MKSFTHSVKRYAIVAVTILITTSLFWLSAFATNITKNELSIHEKSDGVIINNANTSEEDWVIAPDIEFTSLGDFITYKLTINNEDTEEYRISSISDNNTNQNITISYSYDQTSDSSDKNIYITLTYENELTNILSLSDFEVTVNYTTKDKDRNNTDDEDNEENEDDLAIPNTGIQTEDPSASSPNTGNQTFSKTFTIQNSNENHSILNILPPIILTCVLIALSYLALRHLHKKSKFNLTKLSRSRQTAYTLTELIIAGLIIAGGTISITHATESTNINLYFDMSKVSIHVEPTATRTVQFINNAPEIVTNISETSKTCELYFNETSCNITLPSFTTIPNHEIIGWNTDSEATVALYQPGETISLSADTTLYTITSSSLTASFINQHEDSFTISQTISQCSIYNSDADCEITTPTANKVSSENNAEFLGWNTDPASMEASILPGETIKISNNITYYSIASTPVSTIVVSFINNDPAGVLSISETKKTCTIQTEESSCFITLPDFTVVSGYEKIGWNSNSSAEEAKYQPGAQISLSHSTTLYTISKTTFTVHFANLHEDFYTIAYNSASCYAYNGASHCSITPPSATIASLGMQNNATFFGWDTDREAEFATYEAGNDISIVQNQETLYSVIGYTISLSIRDSNAIKPIPNSNTYCTLIANDTTCQFRLPALEPTSSEYEIIGWSDSYSNQNQADYSNRALVTITQGEEDLYTISRKQVTATFNNSYEEYFTISSSSSTCYIYNGSSNGCDAITPTVNRITNDNNISFLGWDTNPNAQTPSISSDVNNTKILENTTYYLITKTPVATYSVSFVNDLWDDEAPNTYFNATNSECLSRDDGKCTEIEKQCTIYSGENSCTITTPTFNTESSSEWEASGYSAKHPTLSFNPAVDAENIINTETEMTIDSNNNGRTYYTITKKTTPLQATFHNQHSKYLYLSNSIDSTTSESCYQYNYGTYCKITTPYLFPHQDYEDTATNLAWSTNENERENTVGADEAKTININENKDYYSLVDGIGFTIAFNFSSPVNSLSYTSTQCVPSISGGCYLSDLPPRIYSAKDTPYGFGKKNENNTVVRIYNLPAKNFTADTTLYAMTDEFGMSSNDYSIATTKYVRLDNGIIDTSGYCDKSNNTREECYQIDFQTGINNGLANDYANATARIFQKVPQLKVLRGKIRFFESETYNSHHGGGQGLSWMIGIYGSVDIKVDANNNQLDSYTIESIAHELGHVLDSAWGELYGTNITGTSTSVFQKHESELTPFEQEYKERIEECRNRYYIGKGYSQNDYDIKSENCVPHEGTPEYDDLYDDFWRNKFNKDTDNPKLPLRAYSYTSKYEFFADSFAVWYHVKSNYLANDITEARGSITPNIENLLNNLLCNPTYDKFYVSNASICSAN